MRNFLFILFLLLAFHSDAKVKVFQQKSKESRTEIPLISLDQIDTIVSKNQLTAIYFWPTWCIPCFMHIPELTQLFSNSKIPLYFIAESFSKNKTLHRLDSLYNDNGKYKFYKLQHDEDNIIVSRTGNIVAFNKHFTDRDSVLFKIKDINMRNPAFYIINKNRQIVYTNIELFSIEDVKKSLSNMEIAE